MSIAIVGVGETDYAWKDPRSPSALAVDAVQRALADAGLTGADVDGIVTESYTLVNEAPADLVAARIGMRQRPFSAHVGIAGSGTVGAPALARMAIESGEASVVVSYYAINLSAAGAGGAYALHAGDRAKAAFEMPFGYYGQAVYFAAVGRPLPPPVRARARGAGRRGGGRPGARPADPERAAPGAADDGRLPRQPDGRRIRCASSTAASSTTAAWRS